MLGGNELIQRNTLGRCRFQDQQHSVHRQIGIGPAGIGGRSRQRLGRSRNAGERVFVNLSGQPRPDLRVRQTCWTCQKQNGQK